MKSLPKILCIITLLSMSSLVWASCPEGYKENDRTGQCKAIPGFKEKVEAEKKEQELKASLATLSPGKFVKYMDITWITKPMNTQEAIEYYLKGRKLDPIEGVWRYQSDYGLSTEHEFVIVKNTFDVALGYQYIGIRTRIVRAARSTDSYYKKRIREKAKIIPGVITSLWNDRNGIIIEKYFDLSYGELIWSSGSPLIIASDGNLIYENARLAYVRLYPEHTDQPIQDVAGSGTGFFVSSDGYIVTNHHVIKGANKITVTTPSGESFEAKVVSTSTSTDLALLRIPYQTKNYLTFANPGSTDIGHQVFTLGYPVSDILGKEVKYTDGSISSLSGLQGDATFFQISVPIQPGNSGGPLVNADGDVVGVVTATAAVGAFYASVGVMPQNVNWAVKGAYASLLLPPTMEMNERSKSNPIANAKWSVVFIETE